MVEISLYVFLIIYAVMLLIFVIFALFNIYTLLVYGFLSFGSFFMTFIFLAGTILVLFISYQIGLQIDWSQTFIL